MCKTNHSSISPGEDMRHREDSTATTAMHLFIDFRYNIHTAAVQKAVHKGRTVTQDRREHWDTTGLAHIGYFNKLSVFCRNTACVGSNK